MKNFLKKILVNLGLKKSRTESPFSLSLFSIPRVHGLSFALNYINKNLTDQELKNSSFVECGLGYGESFSYLAAFAFLKGTTILGFDSFEGFPEPKENDQRAYGPEVKKGQWNVNSEISIKRKLINTRIPKSFVDKHVHLYKGYFEDSLPKIDKDLKISLLNLDVDLYNSYKTCLEELYDKVIDGGIVCFDEYQSDKWTGAKKAIDDFAKIKNIEVHIDTLSGQAFFLK